MVPRKQRIALTGMVFGLLVVKLCCLLRLVSGENLKCSSPLGVESKAVTSMRASSNRTDHDTSEASLYGEKAWCANTNDESQHIEVDFGRVKIVTGVATKGHGSESSWTESYELQYSLDGITWFDYTKPYDTEKHVFKANTDNGTIVKNDLDDHLVAQHVRIKPLTWSKSICMRVEIYGCIADCDTWLGMAHEKEPSVIPDSALTSSSYYNNDQRFTALQARLFKQTYQSPIGRGAWIPSANDQNQYLQVDLGRVTQVSGFVIMGRQFDGHRVSQYWVAYSNDGTQWSDVTESGSAKVFTGSSSGRGRVEVTKLSPPLYARYIRLRPKAWYIYIALRAEIIGCREAGHRDLGMTRREISDGSITASSNFDNQLRPEYSRLGLDNYGGAWVCSSSDDTVNQYLQVYLGSTAVPVTAVATQGRHDHAQYVTFFKLEFSNSTGTASWRVYTEDNREKLFSRGTDKRLVERVNLAEVVLAKYIRFRPKSWIWWAAFRVEIYGFKGTVPQIFDQSPGNITLYEYQDVTLRCQAVGSGSITVKWYREKTLLQTRSSNDNADLLIVNLKGSDSGGYRCEAKNSHGSDSYSLHLSVRQSKDPYAMCASPVILEDPTRIPDNTIAVSDKDETFIRREKWYVFNAGPANEIPEMCVKAGGCGGTTSGWLKHTTPSIADGVLDTKVCFSSNTDCCSASAKVLVRHCHGYVVYKFYDGIPSSIGARICVSQSAKFSSGSIPRIVTIANGYALDGFLEASHMDVASTMTCSTLCINSPQCLSINYSREERVCELNSSTKSKEPKALNDRSGFVYFEKFANPGGEI